MLLWEGMSVCPCRCVALKHQSVNAVQQACACRPAFCLQVRDAREQAEAAAGRTLGDMRMLVVLRCTD